MAKLHSGKRGKSGSRRPKVLSKPEWVAYNAEEIKEAVARLAKEGVPAARIGQQLRDEYGVPSARPYLGMTVGQFLEHEKLSPKFPDDLISLIKRAVGMRGHLRTNKGDLHNKVKLLHVESKIHRLAKYYREKGKLPAGWKYDPETAALLVK
ncbi:MAG TPA: 30S ribosomal protein S15 [Candidatus Bilamarchaeaceae archaeon]|nr:30S ribosomal protein S15 [Candidatus Bilamarchaeaceae archaeon]